MNGRIFSAIMIFLVFYATGCKENQKKEQIWEHTKITDLGPIRKAQGGIGQKLKSINFELSVFKIPQENFSQIEEAWKTIDSNEVNFNNLGTFKRNHLRMGTGMIEKWNKINDLLTKAIEIKPKDINDLNRIYEGYAKTGTRKVPETNMLMLFSGKAYEHIIAALKNDQNIFYINDIGEEEGLTLGKGTIALQIKATKKVGIPGQCEIDIRPVFLSSSSGVEEMYAERKKIKQYNFSQLGFQLNMQIGDFVLLGPDRFISDKVSLPSLLFEMNEDRKTANFYMLTCTRISE